MGFYFRKSTNFGGVCFNFSKSEMDESVGVKGIRVRTNSKGNYIHIGHSGLYYRVAIRRKKSKHHSASQAPSMSQMQQQVIPQVSQEQLYFQDIESGDLTLIVHSSSQDLVNEINEKQKKSFLWPLAIFFVFIPGVGILLAIIAAIMLFSFVDKRRKTTILIYDIEEDTEQMIQSFYNAFDELADCSAAWHVTSQASVRDKKYHAGASQIVNRTPIRIRYKTPKYLMTNVKVPSIPVGSQTLYFFLTGF